MDNIDIKIINLLKINSRTTASEIAGKIKLSIPAVSDRLKKLDSSGVIEKYTVILNSKKLNKSLTAIMFLSLDNPKYAPEFIRFINSEDEIIECHYLAGDFDYVMKITTNNTETLEVIIDKIKLVAGVIKTKTTVALSEVKNIYSV